MPPCEHLTRTFVTDVLTWAFFILSFRNQPTNPRRFEHATGVIRSLLSIAKYCHDLQLALVSPLFIDVHVQALTALTTFCEWLSQFCQTDAESAAVHDVVEQTVNIAVSTFMIPDYSAGAQLISLAAAELLAAVASRVRPTFLLAVASFKSLVEQLSAVCAAVDETCSVRLMVAVSNAFIVPWVQTAAAAQNWCVSYFQFHTSSPLLLIEIYR